MPEIRERKPNDFIKSKGKHQDINSAIASRFDYAVRFKAPEHQNKKEQANEYAVGVTEEAAAEVAIRQRICLVM